MIRKESFTPDVETFASKRRDLLTSTDQRLQPHVKDALKRVGLPSWQSPIITQALDVFDETARSAIEEWGPDIDALRNEFERELTEALDKTKKVDKEKFDQQVERVTRWVSVMAINAGTEAATSTDPDPAVGLEWVTMEDEAVRPMHKEVHGQQVTTGKPFTVGGVKMLYPGEPVGPPENWINCRCVVRPAMLDESASSVTAAAPVSVGGDKVDEEPVVEEEPPMIPDDEANVQLQFHGVAAPEGVMSGDRRMFKEGALSNRPLPITLKSMFIDDEGHKGSQISGRVDKMWKDGNLFKYEGTFDLGEAGYETVRLIADQMWRGVSVDVDQAVGGINEAGDGTEYSEARVSGLTVCAIPAFAETFIALGPWPMDEETPVITGETASGETVEFAPENVPERTKDGPGWITHPEPTKDITSYWVRGPGAAKIRWGIGGDFNRCRMQLAKYVQNPDWLAGLCANLHYRALGIWPGPNAHTGGTVAMKADETAELASVTLTASALMLTPVSADYFRRIDFTRATPMTIEEDGHVYGHMAQWGTCHIGFPENCTTVPHSQTNYAHFLTGEYLTDSGRVPVGQLTLGGGHADERLGLRAAMAHYDNTGSAVADVTVWEDEFGIAFSGKLRDGLDEKTIRELMASPLSGDWRGVIVNGVESLEMCAALAVNVPGFAVPRVTYAMDGDHQLSLVAAGVLEPAPVAPVLTDEFMAQMAEYNKLQERKAKIAELKTTARSFRLENLKAKIEKTKEK